VQHPTSCAKNWTYQKTEYPIRFLPNNSTPRTLHETKLPFDQLLDAAREAHVLPGLKQLLTKKFHPGEEGVSIHKKVRSPLEPMNLLFSKGAKVIKKNYGWYQQIKNDQTREEANNVYSLPSIPQTIPYLHAATGFPVKETWMDAIKAGNFITWPSLTILAVRKHFPDSDGTQKGHMKKQHQGVRSTNLKENTRAEDENIPGNTNTEVDPSPPKKMRDIFIKIYNTGKMHSNQTGRFPAMSSKGNQYIMVLVDVDGNYIDSEPMKNKSEGSIIKDYLILWTRLTELGTVQPIRHILDNEVSDAYKAEIKKNCTMQLVPPGNHQ
jgi:hypothetical protein